MTMHATSDSGSTSPDHGDAHDGRVGHVVPLWILATVWGSLLILTWLTVRAVDVNLGRYNLWLAMAIAAVKASLVALFFMHLRWDSPFNAIVFIGSLLFVAIFVGLSMQDSLDYQQSIRDYQDATPPAQRAP